MSRLGVLLTRAQPFHKGHIEVIKKALSENDNVLIVIGSSDKCGTERNPLSIDKRIELFDSLLYYPDFIDDYERLWYMELKDWSQDSDIPYESVIGSENTDFENISSDWGMYFYYNIVSEFNEKEFTLYYNDNEKIIDSWFPRFIKERITISSEERIKGYSSSEVRQAFKDNNMEYLHDALCYLRDEDIIELKEDILV